MFPSHCLRETLRGPGTSLAGAWGAASEGLATELRLFEAGSWLLG